MIVRWLGSVPYIEALALQEQLVGKKAADDSLDDELLLLEHEPVYTIGRTPDQTSLRGGSHLSHEIVQINRGGKATYHGPGQLVGYPILRLQRYRRDLHAYLRSLEETLIGAASQFGIAASRRDGLTGVWVADRKLASIGVGVRRWISMHGFALNVCGDLSPFSEIVPCGIAGVKMTNMALEAGRVITVSEVAEVIPALLDAELEKLRQNPVEPGNPPRETNT